MSPRSALVRALIVRPAAVHPKGAPPLMTSSGLALRPFNGFFGQAIPTSKQRSRDQLPWERVERLR